MIHRITSEQLAKRNPHESGWIAFSTYWDTRPSRTDRGPDLQRVFYRCLAWAIVALIWAAIIAWGVTNA